MKITENKAKIKARQKVKLTFKIPMEYQSLVFIEILEVIQYCVESKYEITATMIWLRCSLTME